MKYFNVNGKRSSLLAKGITVLSLSIALQGFRDCNSNIHGTYYNEVCTLQENDFFNRISNITDISQSDEKGVTYLYAAVCAKKRKLVEDILERINKAFAPFASLAGFPKSPYEDPGFENFKRDNPDIKLPYQDEQFPNSYNKNTQKTALGIAIEKGYTEIVKLLATCPYIDINKAKADSTSLLEALLHGKKEIAKFLLEQPNIDIGQSTCNKTSKSTPLGIAIKKGYTEIVTKIVERIRQDTSLDINKAKFGSTSLLEPLLHSKKDIAKFLLEQPNIDIDTPDSASGSSPLHLAIEQKFEDIAVSIIDKPLKSDSKRLSVQNKKLETALHLAIKYDLSKVVNNLVNKLDRDDFYIKDQKDKTALHTAARVNNQHAFTKVFKKICTLSSTNRAITRLSEKDKNGYTVFASTYLPKHIKQRWIHVTKPNLQMFEYVLKQVSSNLTIDQWKGITNEIDALENKGRIKEKYADALRNIVNSRSSSRLGKNNLKPTGSNPIAEKGDSNPISESAPAA